MQYKCDILTNYQLSETAILRSAAINASADSHCKKHCQENVNYLNKISVSMLEKGILGTRQEKEYSPKRCIQISK